MRFYRGLTVDASDAAEVMRDIRSSGLSYETSKRPYLRYRPDANLISKTDLTLHDTRSGLGYDSFFACGTLEGALHYASRFNRQSPCKAPIVIEFHADIRDALVDGVDCVYDLFQASCVSLKLETAVRDIYGEAGLWYARRAWAKKEHPYRIALADLMVADPAVVDFHYANRKLIKASNGLSFHNAFALTRSVPASAIINVFQPLQPYAPGIPHVVVNEVLER